MRSHALRILHFVTSDVGQIFLALTLAVGVASMPAHAQGGIWQVNAEHSIVRLSWGSGSRSAEAGVVRVSGKVVFDSADPLINFDITPYGRPGPNNSEASFKAKRSAMTSDGKLAVNGDLTLTRVERSVTLNPTEGYYGAEYGTPVAHTATHEVTLVFPGASLPAAQNGAMELVATTNISRERFPQMLAALALGNWPSMVVEDEKCTMPSKVGTDYSGGTCTGTPVATATRSLATATVGGGTGYYGFKPAVVPDGSQATLTLDLKLNQMAATSSVASGMANAAGN
jgi:polyisoprenoid-binding protein YceI